MNKSQNPSSPGLALSQKAQRTQEAPISTLMAAALANPGMINLAAGFVDPTHLPTEACARIAQRILTDPALARSALQYDTTLGLAPLRRKALEHLEKLEGKSAAAMGLTDRQLVITTGSQQALYLIADAMVDVGDIVIAGDPSYFVFTGTLQTLGATVLTAPMDEDGLDVDAVANLLEKLQASGRLPRVKFIYCTSYYDNPTGLTLSLARRRQLLDVAKRFSRTSRILILEDGAYRELRYEGDALPSIKSFDPDNRHTILTQTFSKPFSPGLKLGYTAMPQDLLDAVLHQKGNHDFGSASLCQHIAMEALSDGSYAAHVEVLQREYRHKRDAMLAALDRHMPSGATWTRPQGGLYVWVTLPEPLDTTADGPIYQRCVQQGVLWVPGDYCFQPDELGQTPVNHLRLSFGQVAYEQIEEGIRRLGLVVGEAMSQMNAASPSQGAGA